MYIFICMYINIHFNKFLKFIKLFINNCLVILPILIKLLELLKLNKYRVYIDFYM